MEVALFSTKRPEFLGSRAVSNQVLPSTTQQHFTIELRSHLGYLLTFPYIGLYTTRQELLSHLPQMEVTCKLCLLIHSPPQLHLAFLR